MTIDDSIASACQAVPGLQSGVLVLLPDSLQIGGIGEGMFAVLCDDRAGLAAATALHLACA